MAEVTFQWVCVCGSSISGSQPVLQNIMPKRVLRSFSLLALLMGLVKSELDKAFCFSLAVHPDRITIATGQVAGTSKDGKVSQPDGLESEFWHMEMCTFDQKPTAAPVAQDPLQKVVGLCEGGGTYLGKNGRGERSSCAYFFHLYNYRIQPLFVDPYCLQMGTRTSHFLA